MWSVNQSTAALHTVTALVSGALPGLLAKHQALVAAAGAGSLQHQFLRAVAPLSQLACRHHWQQQQQQGVPQQAQQQQRQPLWSRQYSIHAAAVPSSRDLADILKMQLLQDKTADEVEHIWMSHHESSSSHVATVMSKEELTVLAARAAASPLFVLPLRKPPKVSSG